VNISCKVGLVIFVLLVVMIIFISPAVDLEPTALRSIQMANLLFALLALAGITVSANLHPSKSTGAPNVEFSCIWTPKPDLVDLNCVRLC
jgi:uncharacterized membrane protein